MMKVTHETAIAVTPILPMSNEGARQLHIQDQPHTLQGPCSQIISHFKMLQPGIKPSAAPLGMNSDRTGRCLAIPAPGLPWGMEKAAYA